MTSIGADHAWEWVLAASAAVRSQAGAEHLRVNDPRERLGPLTLAGSGEWELDTAVEPEARMLFDRYLPLCAPGTEDLVVGQMGQSLDGRVTTRPGVCEIINGRDGLIHLHRLRALVDAVLVGRGTVACDDPLLTVRHSTGPNPVRVVLDPGARLSGDRRVFHESESETLHLVAEGVELPAEAGHSETLSLPRDPGQPIPPETVLAALAKRGLRRVLVEGGGRTVSQFMQEGALTHLHVLVAPVILGRGVPGFSLPESAAVRPERSCDCSVHPLGSDTLFALRFNRSSAS